MPLGRISEPFDHPDWAFEIKYDGFRALAYVDGNCSLVSRKAHTFRFPPLSANIAAAVPCPVVLDGEIVCLDDGGRPQFYDLMFRRAEPYFCAFDVLWRDGKDLCGLPLLKRKRILRAIVPASGSRLLYVEHHENAGVELFRAACAADLEGLVAKSKDGLYNPEASTWVKIKNRDYSQAVGRHDLFTKRAGR
jgi:bifunctional non-homologous end joining protein LigD